MAVSTGSPASVTSEVRRRVHRPRDLGLTAVFLLLAACAPACKGTPSTPEETLREFLSDLKSRKAKEAWALLSKESQQAIIDDDAVLAKAAGSEPETDPARLLYERAEIVLLNEPESISVASRPGDSVLLRVAVEGGKSATVRMVREGQAWKVDLLKSVQPFRQEFEPVAADEHPDEEARTSTTTDDE